jgi:hypothetical protein
MQSILKALEKAGRKVSAEGWASTRLKLRIDAEAIEIRLDERRARRRVAADPKGSPHSASSGSRWETQGTGRLVFGFPYGREIVDDVPDKAGPRRLEDRAGEIFTLLQAEADERRERRLAWEVEEAKRREAEAAQRKLEAQWRHVRHAVVEWRKAEDLRAFARAVEHRAKIDGGLDLQADLANWIEWIHANADRIDPLTEGVRALVDENYAVDPWEYPDR